MLVLQQPHPPGTVLIEIDTLRGNGQEKNRNKQKFQKRGKKAFKCYGYSKPGHFTRDYRSRNMMPETQLNILERDIVGDEWNLYNSGTNDMWEVIDSNTVTDEEDAEDVEKPKEYIDSEERYLVQERANLEEATGLLEEELTQEE